MNKTIKEHEDLIDFKNGGRLIKVLSDIEIDRVTQNPDHAATLLIYLHEWAKKIISIPENKGYAVDD